MAWELKGNKGTNPATDFVGTTDSRPLAIRTGGAERMRIAPDGKIGIGTNNSPSGLSVAGSSEKLAAGNEYAPFGIYRAGTLKSLLAGYHSTAEYAYLQGMERNVVARDLILQPSGGNVGIGTPTNPKTGLQIPERGLQIGFSDTVSDNFHFTSDTVGGARGLRIWNGNYGSGGHILTALSDGRVGIGTWKPDYALHLKTGWAILGLDTQDINQHSGIRLHENGAVKWHIWTNGSAGGNQLIINSDAATGVVVDQNGNIGLGLTSSGAKLDVAGDAAVRGSAIVGAGGWGRLKLRHIDGKHWQNDNDDALFLNWNTRQPVFVGQDTVSADLHVSGDVLLSSDARLKTEVTPIAGALEKLQKIRGVEFAWLAPDGPFDRSTQRRDVGVIAQEVESVLPELVHSRGDEGYKGVNYNGLIGVLIEASKELKEENDALRRKIEALALGT